jgi:hypothetical protein
MNNDQRQKLEGYYLDLRLACFRRFYVDHLTILYYAAKNSRSRVVDSAHIIYLSGSRAIQFS